MLSNLSVNSVPRKKKQKNMWTGDTADWIFQFSLFNRLYLYHADTLKRDISKNDYVRWKKTASKNYII